MNQKKNLLTAALAVLTAFSSVSAQGGEDGGSTYEKFRVGGYGEMVANFKDYGINRYWGSKVGNPKTDRNTISIPRFVIAFDYKFTPKWILGAEIEFESGGTGAAYELENSCLLYTSPSPRD